MKKIIPYGFLLIAGLLGCKKAPAQEEVIPNPPQPPANCRIVRTIDKTLTTGFPANYILDPETITLDDGEKVQIGTVAITTYAYDEKGRIINSREQAPGGNYRVTNYAYQPHILLINREILAFTVGNKPYFEHDTIQLNEQDLLSRYSGLGESTLLYNANKQRIGEVYDHGQSYVYETGNLVKLFLNATWLERNGQFVPINYLLKRFSYNLDRPTIPVIYQYNGQPSRNLPIKEIWETQQSTDFADGPVYQKIYKYTYDKLGRVRRRVIHGKALNRGWLLEDDLYGIGITDYEYECP